MSMSNILVQFQVHRVEFVEIRVLGPRAELVFTKLASQHLSRLQLPQLDIVGIVFKKVYLHSHGSKLRSNRRKLLTDYFTLIFNGLIAIVKGHPLLRV